MSETTLTFDELHERARERAEAEGVPVRYLGSNRYAVPSRKTFPGRERIVRQLPTGALLCTIEDPTMDHCWPFQRWGTCTHVAAVQIALEGAAVASRVVPPVVVPGCRTCDATNVRLFDGECAECWFDRD